jgi:ribosomal-protein-alanine N-acetyltransferase
MEGMFARLDPGVVTATRDMSMPAVPAATWRDGLPVLTGARLGLRELTLSDAPALLSLLTTEEVARFISQPPASVEGFERFVQWTWRERQHGRHVCFAVVPDGMTTPIGIFQVRQLEPGFATGEWGFAIGSPYWGSGLFVEAARLVVDFAVDSLGVHRLEARAAAVNGRGNGALRKLGAVQEGVLRRAFRKDGRQMDQTIWSIIADEWRQAKAVWARSLVH